VSGVLHIATPQELVGSPAALLAERLSRRARPHAVVDGVVRDGVSFADALAVLDLQRLFLREIERLRAPLLVVSHGDKSLLIAHLASRGIGGVVRAHWHHGTPLSALARAAVADAVVVDDIAAVFDDAPPQATSTKKKASSKKASSKKKAPTAQMCDAWGARIDRILGPVFDDADRIRLGRRRRRRR
jgi:hypothetical protein